MDKNHLKLACTSEPSPISSLWHPKRHHKCLCLTARGGSSLFSLRKKHWNHLKSTCIVKSPSSHAQKNRRNVEILSWKHTKKTHLFRPVRRSSTEAWLGTRKCEPGPVVLDGSWWTPSVTWRDFWPHRTDSSACGGNLKAKENHSWESVAGAQLDLIAESYDCDIWFNATKGYLQQNIHVCLIIITILYTYTYTIKIIPANEYLTNICDDVTLINVNPEMSEMEWRALPESRISLPNGQGNRENGDLISQWR